MSDENINNNEDINIEENEKVTEKTENIVENNDIQMENSEKKDKKTKNRDITVDEIDKFFRKNKIKAVKGLYSEDDFAKLHSIAETAMKNGNSKFNAMLAVVQQ